MYNQTVAALSGTLRKQKIIHQKVISGLRKEPSSPSLPLNEIKHK
jgi:hypothetical protein